MYVVAVYTMGSFHGWATDPMTLDEVTSFVANPPEVWRPRPQDRLVIFELTTTEHLSAADSAESKA